MTVMIITTMKMLLLVLTGLIALSISAKSIQQTETTVKETVDIVGAENAAKTHVLMGKMLPRDGFIQQERVDGNYQHELVFAIQQLNQDKLEQIVNDISSPISPDYQKWLTYSQVGELTSNLDGAVTVRNWLEANSVTITWESNHHDYLKAKASISTWENLLQTYFYYWKDESLNQQPSDKDIRFVRSIDYSLPIEIRNHLSAVFHTSQVPPKINKSFYRGPPNASDGFKSKMSVRKLRGDPTSNGMEEPLSY